MRITHFMLFNHLSRALQKNTEEYVKFNSMLASGKRIEKPSDDAAGMMRALDYRVNINDYGQYIKNIERASFQLTVTDKVMNSVSESLLKLKELLISGQNSRSPENRAFCAKQSGEWRDFLLGLSNTRLEESYLFSGNASGNQAFTLDPLTGRYVYNGDAGERRVLIDRGATLSSTLSGGRVFSFSLNSPMPSELPDGTPVAYTQTTNPATGITTITVEIGVAGDPAYDVFSISSIMDLANTLSAAWQLKNTDGTALNADPAISEEMAMRRLTALLAPLDAARTQVLNAQSEIGTRQVHLSDQAARHKNATLNLKNGLSATEDANIEETITEILKTETALQAMRQAASRILSQSLLDFLK